MAREHRSARGIAAREKTLCGCYPGEAQMLDTGKPGLQTLLNTVEET